MTVSIASLFGATGLVRFEGCELSTTVSLKKRFGERRVAGSTAASGASVATPSRENG
jgi:hypothetical protein